MLLDLLITKIHNWIGFWLSHTLNIHTPYTLDISLKIWILCGYLMSTLRKWLSNVYGMWMLRVWDNQNPINYVFLLSINLATQNFHVFTTVNLIYYDLCIIKVISVINLYESNITSITTYHINKLWKSCQILCFSSIALLLFPMFGCLYHVLIHVNTGFWFNWLSNMEWENGLILLKCCLGG